ncbi:hypothetical protein [uncultured Methanobrevibacter sp.]|uniref:hypothetical protein n=1 Tax=uncultured Methanobrevibacter sp. TaxID=253161 RepID=UPI00261939CF|nr:hypothetical protein [uncultured Methanobrevibacter sp.]
MRSWRRTSVLIFAALLLACILLFAFSFVSSTPYTGQSVADEYNVSIGQSMFAGQSILGVNKTIEVPLLSNFGFIAHELMAFDIQGILMTLSTGVVPFDFTSVSSSGIDSYGNAIDIEGPGYLDLEDDKLIVKGPDTYIWGYSTPYKLLCKTDSGVDVIEGGKVVQSVPTDQIKDLNYSSEYYNNETIRNWYNYDADVGSTFTLEKGIYGFSDGRSDISSDQVPQIFGKEVTDYVAEYPTGNPILLYMGNYTEENGEVYGTSLGSHPEYGDSIREVNAKQFVEAWNGTIIPPNSTSTGKDYVYFEAASDSEAPGGSAAHGVCPSARALRAAVLAEGFGLPVGMDGTENAVLFGYNPASDITVSNNHDYPVKINMWTEGSGTGMGIYAQITRYIPA